MTDCWIGRAIDEVVHVEKGKKELVLHTHTDRLEAEIVVRVE
jgi:hypothetical protein